jgi:DNA phosphorothioation-dependent restriction protein DptG
MVDEGKTDQYKKKIQQTRSEIKKAQDDVEEDIREFESDWLNTLSSAKEVQKLVGESKERNRAMNEIEYFVTDEIWDNSKDINQLINTWESLEQTWREVRVDWEQFQKENSLNDQTIGLLKDLADGDEVSFSRMTDDVAEEILSVSELKNVLKVTI